VFCVLLILIYNHYEHFTSEEIVIIIEYSSFIISNMKQLIKACRFVLLSHATELSGLVLFSGGFGLRLSITVFWSLGLGLGLGLTMFWSH